MRVDPRTGWTFYKPARRNLSPSSPSSSSAKWDSNHWTRRSWNSWHSSRSDHSWIFLRQDQFWLTGRNFPTTDRVCRQNTHWHDTFVHVQRITERSAQVQSLITRGSSRLPWCVKSSLSSHRHVAHVAALATEHVHTISFTYITCLPTIFSLTVLSNLDPEWIGPWSPARDTAEWRIQ